MELFNLPNCSMDYHSSGTTILIDTEASMNVPDSTTTVSSPKMLLAGPQAATL
jgi:hypothetical protein